MAWDQPQPDLWQARRRMQRGEPEGRGERQLEPAAESVAVDQRHRRHCERIKHGKGRLATLGGLPLGGGIGGSELENIGAGAEGPPPGTGDDQRPHSAGQPPCLSRSDRRIDLVDGGSV